MLDYDRLERCGFQASGQVSGLAWGCWDRFCSRAKSGQNFLSLQLQCQQVPNSAKPFDRALRTASAVLGVVGPRTTLIAVMRRRIDERHQGGPIHAGAEGLRALRHTEPIGLIARRGLVRVSPGILHAALLQAPALESSSRNRKVTAWRKKPEPQVGIDAVAAGTGIRCTFDRAVYRC
jgi:hypothetical protein